MTTKPEVLVVEDEEGVRKSVAAILRLAGNSVREAEDGNVALALLAEQSAQVMVLDVQMPNCDGVAVLEALDSPPVVVLISAHALDPELQHRIGPKVFVFLKKPFQPDRLIEAVAAAAERR